MFLFLSTIIGLQKRIIIYFWWESGRTQSIKQYFLLTFTPYWEREDHSPPVETNHIVFVCLFVLLWVVSSTHFAVAMLWAPLLLHSLKIHKNLVISLIKITTRYIFQNSYLIHSTHTKHALPLFLIVLLHCFKITRVAEIVFITKRILFENRILIKIY